MIDLGFLKETFQQSEEHGFEQECLPRGKYPVRVEKVQRSGTSSNKGTPFVDLQLRVIDGPFAKRVTFIRQYLSNCMDEAVYQQISRGAGGSEDDTDKGAYKFYNMTSGFVKSLGVAPQDVDPGQFASAGDASLEYWNVRAWEGRTFVAGLSVETAEAQIRSAKERGGNVPSNPADRNQLASFYPLDEDQKKKLQEEEFPKQREMLGGAAERTPVQSQAPASGRGQEQGKLDYGF